MSRKMWCRAAKSATPSKAGFLTKFSYLFCNGSQVLEPFGLGSYSLKSFSINICQCEELFAGVGEVPLTPWFNANVAMFQASFPQADEVRTVERVFQPLPVLRAFQNGVHLLTLAEMQGGTPVLVDSVPPDISPVQAVEKLFERLVRPTGEPADVVKLLEHPKLGHDVWTEVKAAAVPDAGDDRVVDVDVDGRAFEQARHVNPFGCGRTFHFFPLFGTLIVPRHFFEPQRHGVGLGSSSKQ